MPLLRRVPRAEKTSKPGKVMNIDYKSSDELGPVLGLLSKVRSIDLNKVIN